MRPLHYLSACHLFFVAYVVDGIDREREEAHGFGRHGFADHHDADACGQFGMLFFQYAAGFHQVIYALARVGGLERTEKQQLLVDGQVALRAHLDCSIGWKMLALMVLGMEATSCPTRECAFWRASPSTTGCKPRNDMCPAQHLSLPPEHLGREVVRAAPVQEQGTVVAFGLVFRALPAVMADAGKRPLVVHRPHDGFAAVYDAAYVFSGKGSLG